MPPKDHLGFLLHHIGCVIDRQSDVVLQERLGIGFSQFKILMTLQYKTGLQQRKIAEYLGQTEASVSRQIHILHNQGLLSSVVTQQNRRERQTTLTVKGQRLAEKAMNVLNEYHAPVFDRLDSKQQSQLLELLRTMHEECCQYNKPGACVSK